MVVQLSGVEERQQLAWKDVFRRRNYTLYDCKYPFRIASETVLRNNKAYKQPSRFARVPHDPLAELLYNQTSAYFGVEFEYDYFMDWLNNLPPRERSARTVVFGVGLNPSAMNMVARLRRQGAMVVSTPNLAGDFAVRDVRDLERIITSWGV